MAIYDIAGNVVSGGGTDGGYYTPGVTQPDAKTMRMSFSASQSSMPSVESRDVTLPAGATPNIQIGTVETLEPGRKATASISGTVEAPLLNLGIPRGENGGGSGGESGTDGFVTTEVLSDSALTGMNGRETGFYLFQASENITINGWDTGAKEMLCYVQHSTAHESTSGMITKYVYLNTYTDLRSGIVYKYNGSGQTGNMSWGYTKKEPAFTSDLTAENILPAITESDAGKVLVVSSKGKWAVGTVSSDGSTSVTDGVGIKSVQQTTTSTADGGTNVITVTLTDGTTSTFNVKNGSKGSTPVRGTDYWTDDDIATIKSYVDDAILGGAW